LFGFVLGLGGAGLLKQQFPCPDHHLDALLQLLIVARHDFLNDPIELVMSGFDTVW